MGLGKDRSPELTDLVVRIIEKVWVKKTPVLVSTESQWEIFMNDLVRCWIALAESGL